MANRGRPPKPDALSNADRQRRYRERRAHSEAELQAGALIASLPNFDKQALRVLAERAGKTEAEVAVKLLSDAIRAEAGRLKPPKKRPK